ncbi:asparagine synthase (glutamine-hydrolyzing) [Sporofaciens musculi]|uniref:asparagine synthase (glutamine-hydrolyzing) n=1 Tax=Sporofaciens musculi TaxID=2681861 RepID=UPI0025A2404F|nr:asparagine synthase (glutamine-hydrolyzing) [Sporofaciens musculi]
MCGIAGSVCFKRNIKVDIDILERMSFVIANRGPDGQGLQILDDGRIGMVHRRLAIIDLSEEANQPMCDADGNIWVVFNGEIYNHKEIRKELNQIKQIHWKTDHSDTEVLIHSYAVWGIKCLKKFRGMFAIALWDKKRNAFYLIRDRLGIKPLYYGITDNRINFSSNVAALLEDKDQSREVDKKAIFDFLSLLAVPAPNTLFKKIKKIPAGHYIEMYPDGKISQKCYWDPCRHLSKKELSESEPAIKGKLLNRLRKSTNLRKVSDVPVGVFLSGGVDSSTNLALFSESEENVNTFTVGYKGTREYKNENKYAGEMAQYCHAIHHDEILDDESIISFLDELKNMCDDPAADPVMISQYYIAKLAIDNGIKVVQVGEGADELFAGYTYWKRHAIYEKLNFIIPETIKKRIYQAAVRKGTLSGQNIELLRRAAENEGIFWGSGAVYIEEYRKKKLFNKAFMRDIGTHKTWDNFGDVYYKCKPWMLSNTVGWMACVNFKFRLPELLLARTDKACMAVGVEGRVPFLDHKLVEWGLRIPEKLKIRKGIHKYILKETVRGLIPDNVIDRKKVGFGLPFIEWYKGRLGNIMKEKVVGFVSQSGFFDEREVRKFMDAKNSDPTGIWALFILSLWWEQYGCQSMKTLEVKRNEG